MRVPAFAVVAALAVSACAPDAVKPSAPFDAWTARVATACRYQMIGAYEVGNRLGMNGTDAGMQFLDASSRLYFGRISADQWTASVVAATSGRTSDPGVACVLAQPRP